MKTFDLVLIAVSSILILWAILSPSRQKKESFGASDWGLSFWGPSVWNGWNYGSASPRKAPPPEMTE
jgi:hypothetical protein